MPFPRRLRGILGTAGTWGVAFSLLATTAIAGGVAVGAIPASVFGLREIAAVAGRALLAGALAGTSFATILAAGERGRTLATLSTRRVALWGALGTAAIPLGLAVALGSFGLLVPAGVLAAGSVLFGALGSAVAVGTVRLARRADPLTLAAPDDAEPAAIELAR